MIAEQTLTQQYYRVRLHSEAICRGLETEDYVVQPVVDVSPPKWHLGHTTWFWETFVLTPNVPDYRIFHADFSYVFNSYYETVGKRVLRTDRGNLSRPTVAGVYAYRAYVDEQMSRFLDTAELSPDLHALILLGFNHEQQHQELLITDIKYILGHNPLLPAIEMPFLEHQSQLPRPDAVLAEGIYTIGYRPADGQDAGSFYFDNEVGPHKVYLNQTTLSGNLVTNEEYLAFIESGGYQDFRHWLSDGWAWVKANGIQAPLYWHQIDSEWWHYTVDGLRLVDMDAPVCHVSHYEADAYARWTGQRLPTEFEWEAAAPQLNWGARWEWTNSAYLPYPGFITAEGAVGEYNGKFMSGQMVFARGICRDARGAFPGYLPQFFSTRQAMAVYGDTFSEELKAVGMRHAASEAERGSGQTRLVVDMVDNQLSESSDLANEVRMGLQATPKRLSSRFFYDAEGSRLFAEIMHSPDYYLTRSEYEILETYKADMLRQFSPDNRPFELVELGAGDGLKTKILLGFFEGQHADFTYAPVDISVDALEGLVTDVRRQWPDLQLNPRHDDYFSALELLSQETDNHKVVLFLGSNIGNFAPDDAVGFYQQLHDRLQPGDLVLTGFDLQKNPAIIHTAYNDREGLTKAFNLNLLRRINRELDATFDLDAFDHYETYNPENGEARSYLVSQKAQIVMIKALDLQVSFQAGEIIHTEISRKFSRVQIEQLARQTGFTMASWFTDSKGYFADVVFEC